MVHVNHVLDSIIHFAHAHPIAFWLIAILGFPTAEIIVFIAIIIGFFVY
jgi:hypothetical protein